MKLSPNPHPIRGTSDVWWYDEPNGIMVIHEIRINGVYERTDNILIPLRGLKCYLKRRAMTDGET